MPAELPDVAQPDLEQPAVKQAYAEQPTTPLRTGQIVSHPIDQAIIPGTYTALLLLLILQLLLVSAC